MRSGEFLSIARQAPPVPPCAPWAAQGPDSVQEIPYRQPLTAPDRGFKPALESILLREIPGDAGKRGSRDCRRSALAEIDRDPAISRVGGRIARAVRAEIERDRDDRIVPAVFAEIIKAALEDTGPPKPAARRQQLNALPDRR